jgi:type II secretory pathway component PulM
VKELWSRLRAAWDNFSPNERALLSVMGVLVGLFLLQLVVVEPVRSAIESARTRAETAEQQLELMNRLRGEFAEVQGRLSAVEMRVQRVRERRNIFTLLESLAGRSSVKVDTMEPQPAQESDRYRETRVAVSLKNVTLTQTVTYLNNLESADELLSVKSLRIRSRADKPELLDVDFTVSTFEPL